LTLGPASQAPRSAEKVGRHAIASGNPRYRLAWLETLFDSEVSLPSAFDSAALGVHPESTFYLSRFRLIRRKIAEGK
jgi:hypothetical protein